tara:strand:- start:947 stop:1906 length:960 start_codon:yes stop_codon:yes gene_type:complete
MKKLIFLLLIVPIVCYGQSLSAEKKSFDNLFKKLDNTGKWGQNDRLGTINYITSEKVKSSLKYIKKGVSISLSFKITEDSLAPNNFNSDKLSSYSHETNELNFKGYNWVTDNFSISYHGHTHSHIDALNHLSHNGLYYNQLKSPDELGVENLKNGVLTKAILIDLPLLKGKEFVEAGYKISVKDIIEFEKKFNVKIERGDILLIRTGRWKQKEIKGEWNFLLKSTGLHYNVMQFLSEREISILGSDGTNDSNPSLIEEEGSPIHKLSIVAMGMPLLDNLNLEQLSKKAKLFSTWEFFISVQPLKIDKGTGSPINAIALF